MSRERKRRRDERRAGLVPVIPYEPRGRPRNLNPVPTPFGELPLTDADRRYQLDALEAVEQAVERWGADGALPTPSNVIVVAPAPPGAPAGAFAIGLAWLADLEHEFHGKPEAAEQLAHFRKHSAAGRVAVLINLPDGGATVAHFKITSRTVDPGLN